MNGLGRPTTNVPLTGNQLIDGLTYGVAFLGPITYAFPTLATDYAYTYESSSGFAAISAQQQAAALFAMEASAGGGFSIEGFTNADFSQGAATDATIRLATSSAPTTAYAYMPGQYQQAGDIWFGTGYNYTDARPGNYGWHTALHEIGHALGLKHAHEAQNDRPALPAAYDSLEYTVMTYRSHIGGSAGAYSYGTFSAPQTYMMADIAALQHLYGADFTTNAGDTVYKWRPSNGDTLVNGQVAIDAGGSQIFLTIWDGGGTDTYDLSAFTTAMTIDLNPGAASVFNTTQLANLGNGNKASGNLYNALLYQGDERSLIENVLCGSGNSYVTGNQAANAIAGKGGADTLLGMAGADNLAGNGGIDKLTGGTGNDLLSGGAGRDVFIFVRGDGFDVIADFDAGIDRINLSGTGLDFGALMALGATRNGDTTFLIDAETSILLEDVRKADLTIDDFRFLL